MIVLTINEHQNISIMVLNHQAGYDTKGVQIVEVFFMLNDIKFGVMTLFNYVNNIGSTTHNPFASVLLPGVNKHLRSGTVSFSFILSG